MLTPVDLDATSSFVTPSVRKKEKAKRYYSSSDDDVPQQHISRKKKRSTELAASYRKKAPPPPPAAELIVVDDVDNANENGIVEVDSQVDLPKTGHFGSYDNELAAKEDSDGGKTVVEVDRNQSPDLLADDSSDSP
jgi:hypothetical protein